MSSKTIKWTSGTLAKCGEYYTLILFYKDEKVYAATLPEEDAQPYMNNNKITINDQPLKSLN